MLFVHWCKEGREQFTEKKQSNDHKKKKDFSISKLECLQKNLMAFVHLDMKLKSNMLLSSHVIDTLTKRNSKHEWYG
jgi:hypothetical protein